jgi:hypoxanthine phosphoribosyltransferase
MTLTHSANGMEADIARVLISRERIAQRVDELARELAATYQLAGEGVVIVPVLAGALIFVSDLIRRLPVKAQIRVLLASSYSGTRGAEPRILYGPGEQIHGRHVLIVDDILDSGGTMQTVVAELSRHGPASLRSCVLLRKPGKAPAGVTADFVGFDIEDVFVVGYGLDFSGYYRNWPDIAVLRPELYA